jgi:membrane protease YdiL (CAAX protease family)
MWATDGVALTWLIASVAWPCLYVIPASWLRNRWFAMGAGGDSTCQAIMSMYVLCLTLVIEATVLPGSGAGPLTSRCYSFSAGDVFRFGVTPVASLFCGSALQGALSALGDRSEMIPRAGWANENVLKRIVVSPFLEELFYRSVLLRFLISGGIHSRSSLVLLSPLIFSISHAHHLYVNVCERGMRFQDAFVVTAVQCTFTYIFGVFESLVFLKSQSLWVCVVAHQVANWFGFPRLRGVSPLVGACHAAGFLWFVRFCVDVWSSL